MNLGETARQQAEYRRGVLLGLTVAEVMLLILFALLLALGALLTKKENSIAGLSARLVEVTQQRKLAETRAEILERMAAGKPTDEFVRELVLARQTQERLKKEEQALRAQRQELQEDRELADALKKAGDPKGRLKELAALGAKLEKELKKLSPDTKTKDLFDLVPEGVALADAARQENPDPDAAREALERAEEVARDNATLKGQVARYRDQMKKLGKGGELPPCWVTTNGQIEYLFDIQLQGGGSIVVGDATPPTRVIDRRDLPIPAELFGGGLTPSRFRALTAPLYEYSQKRECRFYVIARDRTGPTQKVLFKNLLLTVEGHFYKSLR
jgi:hypothetical protein